MSGHAPQQAPENAIRTVAAVALAASVLEWYDFFIYGTASALVFGKVFFPQLDPLVGTLSAFAALGVGFVFRPIGGIVFGHYGDQLGRKKLLVIAIVTMGTATTLIGLLPSYAVIEVWAPVLLIVLRCVQGLAVGGQWGGAAVLVIESAPPGRRGYYGGYVQLGVPAAVIVSNVLFLLLAATLAPGQFATWGWRIPFLLSFVLVVIGLFVQLRFEDTPAFRALREHHDQSQDGEQHTEMVQPGRWPILDVIRTYPKQIVQAALLLTANNAFYYVTIVFFVAYTRQELGYSQTPALALSLMGSATAIISIPISAALSDRIGRKKVLVAGTTLMAVCVFPCFLLLETRVYGLMLLSLALSGVALGFPYGPMAAFFTEAFSTRVRYSGASLAYQLGAVLGGGFAPFISTALLAGFGTVYAVAWYLLVLGILSAVAATTLRETAVSVRDPTPADDRPEAPHASA